MMEKQKNASTILHKSSSMMLLTNNTSRVLRLKRNVSYDKDCHISVKESNSARGNETWSTNTGRISIPKMTNRRNMFLFQRQNSINSGDSLDSSVSINNHTTPVVIDTRIPLQISIRRIRSCMKGSRQSDTDTDSFDSNDSSPIGTAKNVKIPKDKSELVQIKYVDSYLRYSSDLWYKKKQLDQMYLDLLEYTSNADHPSYKSFGSYVTSYNILRREIELADHEIVSDVMESKTLPSCGFLTKKSYGQFVNVLSKKDFDGTERYIGIGYEQRKMQIQKYSKKMVTFYRMEKAMMSCYHHNRSDSSRRISICDDEKIASYSRSLSVKDRCWSYIVGTAQHAAAVSNPVNHE